MWNLISLKEQCKIKMIEAFYETNEPITINTLSELTNTSTRSIKNHLEELKETISEIGGEFESSSEGINFKIPINIGLDFFQKRLLRESIGFKFLEKIFFDESLTNNELIDDLFISKSTLNRLAKTVDEELKPYGLSLETSPYKVVGDEQLIHNFYTIYFVAAYSSKEWPFECLKKEIIDDVFPSPIDYYQSTSGVMNYRSFKFRFAVSLTRNLQGYSIKSNFSDNQFLAKKYQKLTTEIKDIIDHFPFNTLDEKNKYVSELAISKLSISKKVLQDRLETDENLRNRLEKIEYMINFLSSNFDLPIEDIDTIMVEIDNILLVLAKNTGDIQPKQHILYPPRDYLLVDLYQRRYPTFYDLLKYYMLHLCKNRGFEPTDETLIFLIYSLISKWKNITKYLFYRYNAINLIVYSHLSIRHAESIAESLISDLPEAVNVSVLQEPFLNEEILSQHDFDIIVSAETLILDIEQPIVYMYRSRSSYQYDYLHKHIKTIAKQKEVSMRAKFNGKYYDKLPEYEASVE